MSAGVTVTGRQSGVMSAVRMRALASGSRAAYEAAGYGHPALDEWHAPFVSGHGALSGEREPLAARVHDMIRNDAWVASAIDKKLLNVVGSGLRLNAKPMAEVLGISQEQADAFSAEVETAWKLYTTESGFWCDAERAGPLSSVLGSFAYHRIADGEAFAIIVWRDGAPTGFQTAVQLVHPQRCSNPKGVMDTATLKDGVALDEFGAAVGYHFADSHPGDRWLPGTSPWTWTYVERETDWGRPRVLHVRLRREAGMVRGVSDLVPFLRKGRQLHKYDDYELSAAAINALLAAFIKTPLDADALADALDSDKPSESLGLTMGAMVDAQSELYKAAPIRMGGAQINFLNPGEEVDLVRPEHPNAGFESFVKFGLRNLASVLGITAEQLTQDWSEVNYSSARAALLEAWKGFQALRADLVSGFLAPLYRAWLEEAVDKGIVALPAGAPAFTEAVEAWCGADWIGGARGYIDPQKEAEAAGLRMSLGTSTLEREAAEQGMDWRDIINQRARERREMIALGLDPDVGRPEARIQPQIPTDATNAEDDKSGAQEKRDRSARRASRSGVPLIRRKAA